MVRLATQLAVIAFLAKLAFPDPGHALDLIEGLRTIAERGRDIQIARTEEEAAQGALSLARAPHLPQIDLYGRETWLRDQPSAKTPFGAFPTSQDRFFTYGVKATQLVYDFGKTTSSISAAQFSLQAKQIETARAKNRSALEFILAYMDLLETEEILKVAREEVLRFDAHKKDADARFDAGVITRNEVLQAAVTLADSRQRLLTAESQRSLRASRINSLLQRPLNEEVLPLPVEGSRTEVIPLEQSRAAAEASNADLRDLDARIRAREESTSALRAEYLPTLFVSGGYEFQENQYQVHEDNWSFIAGVNINLSAGGATAAKVRAARSELDALRLTREKLLDAVRFDVKKYHLDLQSSLQKLQVTRDAVGQASENLRLQRLRFQEGVGTATEVLDAVTLYTLAETNAWRASFDVKKAEALLLYSMGRDLVAEYSQ